MDVETAARTDAGRERDHNEDSVLVAEVAGGALLAVADGMGGHRAGDVASELAVDAFADAVDEERDDGRDARDALTAAVERANTRVRERAEDADSEGMGTTLVGAYVADGATVVNVGDSRAYHVIDDAIEQVTVDQSMVRELVDEGVIDPEEADDHPYRHVVSQALGTDKSVDPDVYDVELAGTLVLCSDGLPEEVPESTIHEIVTGRDDLDAAATALVERANERGGSDNVSVVLVRLERSRS